jgi:serine/threonine-protein kinase CTR1
MVLEFCSHGSLYDALKDEAAVFDWPKVIKIFTDALKGVSCLHNWKPQIVHRDLKSLNLLVISK